ncbi:phospholipase D family protein [Marivita sp. S6314]|uniref:phospholipase D family protein n=1 Tax=Marivita sp. S6314 TaxID=2926406 RepID=UPI001FF49C29|nr:phospholipase D family protein [Marivita sp. S6314]MCK0149522.1 phospholipase D family protein [Marivita sp. S6314]
MPHDFEVLVTAEEAWPAFEKAILNAKSEIVAGFRIFDMRTKLRSAEARAVGDDWFDLLAHVVSKGVHFELTVSDFDPVVGTALHELAWMTVRQGVALAEVTRDTPGRVSVTADMHAAKAGGLPWLTFLPNVLKRRNAALADLSPQELERQAVRLRSDDLPGMNTVTHHQKLAVIDNDLLYIGGLDLNERRWDTKDHDLPATETWSDVQVLMRGPEVAEARAHLKTFAQACTGKQPPSAARHLKRTLSTPRRIQFPFLSPRSVLTEIEDAHLKAFAQARHLIHIETQYVRSTPIAEALAEAAQKTPDLRAIIILPALPEALTIEDNDGLDTRYGMALQNTALETIRNGFGDRLTLTTPVRPVLADRTSALTLCGSPTIHVHNKVLVVDDTYAMIGSGNLNGRSLRWDTEAAIDTTDPERVAHTRHKLCQHWWFDPLSPDALSITSLQQHWQSSISRNGVVRPENRTGFLVPHDLQNHADLAQPLPGVTEDMV